MKPEKWIAGTCCQQPCPMTLVTPIGGGQFVCWLHWLVLGL